MHFSANLSLMERLQKDIILKDLDKKIVLLAGPRQVGKTWLANDIGKNFSKTLYLNYDRYEDRKIIDREEWFEDTQLLILDELHKKEGWNNYLKGIYDTKPSNLKILVTGSARLEVFFYKGDSLAGRFFKHRLLPLSLRETVASGADYTIDRLMERGGFPEPFLADDPVEADRWRLQYIEGLLRTDILDFQKYYDIKALQLVFELLQKRVGSPVSFNSIAEDVGASPNTVKKYITILENLYIVFRIFPYSKNIARALTKEPKIYFYDTGTVKGDKGAVFENLIAVSLLKNTLFITDSTGIKTELTYIRTKDKEEVDFCIVKDGKPVEMIETKVTGPDAGKTIYKFNKKYNIPGTAVFLNLKRERINNNIRFRKAAPYLLELDI